MHRLLRVLASALVASTVLGRADASQTVGCVAGGPGGRIPVSGTGGGTSYPVAPPPFELALPLAVVGAPSASVVTEVRLIGLAHTSVGDLQLVLTDPADVSYNLFCRPQGASCDFAGDYAVTGRCAGAGASFPTPCSGASVVPPGAYDQFFGAGSTAWPSGSNGVFNTSLFDVPAVDGTWTLTIYDWAWGDVGAIQGWELCFGSPLPLIAPTAPPLLIAPEDGATLLSPLELSWSAVECAASYDVDLDGAVTSGLSATTLAVSPPPGTHTWAVRGRNTSGDGPWSAQWTFEVPAAPPPSDCVGAGVGDVIPAVGTGDGDWPTTLPTAPTSSSAAILLPAGATRIVRVRLLGLVHGRVGDLQLVLEDPGGGLHNVVHRPGLVGACCGLECDYSGDYSIYESAGLPFPSLACTGDVPAGDYRQDFGSAGSSWPDGLHGIHNTPLGSIPIASGTWTLHLYDWASDETGVLESWELCFDPTTLPTTYCAPTPPGSGGGCLPSISGTANPDVAHSNTCVITVNGVDAERSGTVFYGFAPHSGNWCPTANTMRCVRAPTQRTPGQESGGTAGLCDGTLVLDWNAYQRSDPGALGNPWSPGAIVYVQGWFRDPPSCRTSFLSEAMVLTYGP